MYRVFETVLTSHTAVCESILLKRLKVQAGVAGRTADTMSQELYT